jgi:DNA-binding response OmpR family regulator
MRDKEVLVVDDDGDWAFLIELALGFEGFRVTRAWTGEEALAMVDSGEPDAIVLDIGLPGVDGWEVLRRLAAGGRAQQIPVVVVSGGSDDDNGCHEAELEGRVVLPKPCRPKVVARTVRSLCTKGPGRASA